MFNPQLPEGWHISSRLMAARRVGDALVECDRSGRYVITRGLLILAEGDDYHPSPMAGDWASILEGLLSFVEHDGELYRSAMSGREPEDGYLFSAELAEWAYMNEDELSMARYELDPAAYAD